MTKNLLKFFVLAGAVTLLAMVLPVRAATVGTYRPGQVKYYVNVLGQVLGIKIAETTCPPPPSCAYGTNYDPATGCAIGCLNGPGDGSGSYTPPPSGSSQPSIPPCPSGQSWKCSDGSYPAVNNNQMSCANGGSPTCQGDTMMNQPQPPMDSGQNQGGCNLDGVKQVPYPCSMYYKGSDGQWHGPGIDQPAPNQNQPQPYQNQPQQTCRVNGVDRPGSCDQYPPNQNQQPKQPMMGPGQGPNQGWQQGPGDQNWEEQQKRDEERQKQDNERRLKQMKNDIKNITRGLTQITTWINKAKKVTAIPEEVTAAINGINDLVVKIKAATADNLDEIDMSEIGDLFSTIQEYTNELPMWLQIPNELKRAKSNLTSYQKRYASFVKQAAKVKNFEVPLSDLKSVLDTAAATLAKVDEGIKSGPQNAQETMETLRGFYEDDLGAIGENERAVEFLINFNRNVKNFTSMIKGLESKVNALARNKKSDPEDVTRAKELLAEIKQTAEAIKKAASAKPVDFDEVQFLVEDDFSPRVEELMGLVGSSGFAMPKAQNVQFNMPSSFGQPQPQQPQQPKEEGQNFEQPMMNQGPQMAPGTF